jgi:hypothetical protein
VNVWDCFVFSFGLSSFGLLLSVSEYCRAKEGGLPVPRDSGEGLATHGFPLVNTYLRVKGGEGVRSGCLFGQVARDRCAVLTLPGLLDSG